MTGLSKWQRLPTKKTHSISIWLPLFSYVTHHVQSMTISMIRLSLNWRAPFTFPVSSKLRYTDRLKHCKLDNIYIYILFPIFHDCIAPQKLEKGNGDFGFKGSTPWVHALDGQWSAQQLKLNLNLFIEQRYTDPFQSI